MEWTEILKFSLPLLFSAGVFFVAFLALLLAGMSAMLAPLRKDIVRIDGELKEIKANQARFDRELKEIKALLTQALAERRK